MVSAVGNCSRRRVRLSGTFISLSKTKLVTDGPSAIRIRDDVAFFQVVKAAIVKSSAVAGKAEEELDHAIRQIVSKAIGAGGVIDLFSAALVHPHAGPPHSAAASGKMLL
ncbi:MAG: type I restriction enzyme endonuclease domain-containing protein [Bryobacteraceae bacterium]|jgi:hypothetical protein